MPLQEVVKTKKGLKHYSVSHRSGKNTIGIELEFDNREGSYTDGLRIGHKVLSILQAAGVQAEVEGDGSLHNGREVVIAPVTLDHLRLFSGPAFIQVFDLLQKTGWTTNNDAAGGHMTVGFRSFGRSKMEQYTRLHDLHQFCYKNRHALQAFGRRSESRWAVWYDGDENGIFDYDGTNPIIRNVDKYSALNYRTYNNTLEFRFFNAHTSFDQLLARYELLQLLIMAFNGVNAIDTRKTLRQLVTDARRSKPNAYREFIATNGLE